MAKKSGKRGHSSRQDVAALPAGDSRSSDSDAGSNRDEDDALTYEHAVNLPAHQTKHLAELSYRFPAIETTFRLVQRNDTNSTGSSLWLSSQVLSSYLLHSYAKAAERNCNSEEPRRVLELGSGTGLLSLLMARLGWQVIATDIPPVLDSVLEPNVKAALYQMVNEGKAKANQVNVCELDWMVDPSHWNWHPTLGYPSTQLIDAAASPAETSVARINSTSSSQQTRSMSHSWFDHSCQPSHTCARVKYRPRQRCCSRWREEILHM